MFIQLDARYPPPYDISKLLLGFFKKNIVKVGGFGIMYIVMT
jgi:hypothetical protein